jgi:uncharacterized membrane protein
MAAINPLVLGLFSIGLGAITTGVYFLDIYPEPEDGSRKVAKGFATMIALSGILAAIPAISMLLMSPIPPTYSEYFGTPLAVFSVTALGAAFCIYTDIDLRPLSVLAAGAGVVAATNTYLVVIHYMRWDSYLPVFALSTLSAFSLLPATHFKSTSGRRVAAVFFILLACACLYIGSRAFIGHITGVH